MKKIYLAGAISGKKIEEVRVKFQELEYTAELIGGIGFNPLKISPYSHEKTWADYMKDCIKVLVECDAILMSEGWRKSKGARLEHQIAKKLCLEMWYEANI